MVVEIVSAGFVLGLFEVLWSAFAASCFVIPKSATCSSRVRKTLFGMQSPLRIQSLCKGTHLEFSGHDCKPEVRYHKISAKAKLTEQSLNDVQRPYPATFQSVRRTG